MPADLTRDSVSAIPKITTLWPRSSSRRAKAVIGLMCPVPGKQNAPSRAMLQLPLNATGAHGQYGERDRSDVYPAVKSAATQSSNRNIQRSYVAGRGRSAVGAHLPFPVQLLRRAVRGLIREALRAGK